MIRISYISVAVPGPRATYRRESLFSLTAPKGLQFILQRKEHGQLGHISSTCRNPREKKRKGEMERGGSAGRDGGKGGESKTVRARESKRILT